MVRAKKVYEFVQSKDIKAEISIKQLYKKSIIQWFETYAPDIEYDIDDNLKITTKGYLDLSHKDVDWLPNNLEIHGSLVLEDTHITKLSDNLDVRGNLFLASTNIKEFPQDLKVLFNIDISNTDIDIDKMPKSVELGGRIIKDF